jgi:predicted MPP superfamily phosphohydrolase
MNLFLVTFFMMYGGTNLYFFLKLKAAVPFGVSAGLCLAVLLLFMVTAPVLVRVMEKKGMETEARLTAYAGYLWMGFLFLWFSSSLVLELYHALLRIVGYLARKDVTSFFLSTRTDFYLPLGWGFISASYGYFEARSIKTERITLTSPKIPQSVGKLIIVQISDVHLGLIVSEKRLKAVLAKVVDATPDILVSTGDLVDGQINGLAGLAELIREIRPRYGKFAVTGNHELYAGTNHSLNFMKSAGFRVLRGEEATVPGVITIAGVDDPAIRRYTGSASDEEWRLLDRISAETYTALLKHRPAIEKGSQGRFDLQLSGHVHKGQLFPFNLVTYLFYPVRSGINHTLHGTVLYVSRGTGTWGPPIRFLAPPEVTIIELTHGFGND